MENTLYLLTNQNRGNISLGYGKNSNRTQSKITKDNTVDAVTISYEPNSNCIVGTSYDVSGRTTNDGSMAVAHIAITPLDILSVFKAVR